MQYNILNLNSKIILNKICKSLICRMKQILFISIFSFIIKTEIGNVIKCDQNILSLPKNTFLINAKKYVDNYSDFK